jgi:hypothetical protein
MKNTEAIIKRLREQYDDIRVSTAEDPIHLNADKVENFIREELAAHDKELAERIEGMRKKAKEYPMIMPLKESCSQNEELYWNEGYDKGLADILSLLRGEREDEKEKKMAQV